MKQLAIHWTVSLALLGMMVGCSTPTLHEAEARAFAAPTDLTATLVDPLDIDLKWKDNAKSEAGYFVEYSPDANGEFVIIDALPPNSTHYQHPRLLPQTRFIYRVLPYFGLPSNVAEIRTGKTGPQEEPDPALIKEVPPLPPDQRKSIRSVTTRAAGAPIGLTATLIPPAGVRMQWVDRARDADGYLLEIKPEWLSEFKPSAFLPTNSNSLVSYNFPFDAKFQLRVRAFFYGQPSNTAEQTTGVDPTLGPGQWKKSGEGPSMLPPQQ